MSAERPDNISAEHWESLTVGSAIDPAVVLERHAQTLTWTAEEPTNRRKLIALNISRKQLPDTGSGLALPVYDVHGKQVAIHLRPDFVVKGRKGKRRKYLAPWGQPPVLDVVPRTRAALKDPSVPLWCTEGVKKADSLASHGAGAVISLGGVWNWRSKDGVLPDWDAVELDGRDAYLGFDGDARRNRMVLKALAELAAMLRSRGATVRIALPPEDAGKGVDDFFVGGGTLAELIANATDEVPEYLWPSPAAPLAVARQLARDHYGDDGPTLRWHRAMWLRYVGTHWREIDPDEIDRSIYLTMEHARYPVEIKSGATVTTELRPWNPDERKVRQVGKALGTGVVRLDNDVQPPTWLDTDGDPEGPATGVIGMANGILDTAARTLQPATSRLFTTWSLPFVYHPTAPTPKRWLQFLDELWANDPASPALLQEWCGYLISGRTDLQKILLMPGPPRSGKGVTLWVTGQLVGAVNVIAPALGDLAGPFGLENMIGKTLAIVADTRAAGDHGTAGRRTTERLLSISGEDPMSVSRKHRKTFEGQLGVRFMIASNEVPRFADNSGALVSRFLILPTTESFLGREDTTLRDTLRGELDGIFHWALDGLARLDAQGGRFTEPGSGGEARQMAHDLSSPVSVFVEETCIVGPLLQAPTEDLYVAWQKWCWSEGHEPGCKPVFVRNLKAAIPAVQPYRPRVNGVPGPRRLRGIDLRDALDADPRSRTGVGPGSEDHLATPSPALHHPDPGRSKVKDESNRHTRTHTRTHAHPLETKISDPDGSGGSARITPDDDPYAWMREES